VINRDLSPPLSQLLPTLDEFLNRSQEKVERQALFSKAGREEFI
jgi:hypothetical protein